MKIFVRERSLFSSNTLLITSFILQLDDILHADNVLFIITLNLVKII